MLGGVLPLLLTVALLLWLNESIRFLVLSRAPADKIGGDPASHSPAFQPSAIRFYVLPQSRGVSRKPTREIFGRDFLRATVMLCIAAFVAQLVIVYVVTWMPLVLASIGMPVTSAILASVAFSVGGIFGAIGLARIIDRDNPTAGWSITFFVSAVSIAGIGFLAANWYGLLAITFITGLLTVGANIVLSRLLRDGLSDRHPLDRYRLGGRLGPGRRDRRRAVRHGAGRGRPEHRDRLCHRRRSGNYRRDRGCAGACAAPVEQSSTHRRRKIMHSLYSNDASIYDCAGRLLIVRFLHRRLRNLPSHHIDDHVKRLKFFNAPFPRATFWPGMALEFVGCALAACQLASGDRCACLIVFTVLASLLLLRFWEVDDPMKRGDDAQWLARQYRRCRRPSAVAAERHMRPRDRPQRHGRNSKIAAARSVAARRHRT